MSSTKPKRATETYSARLLRELLEVFEDSVRDETLLENELSVDRKGLAGLEDGLGRRSKRHCVGRMGEGEGSRW